LNQKTFQRSDRVADLIREEVAQMFRNDIADPRVAGITITDVKITPDLITARIYYVSGNKKAEKSMTEGLEKVKGFIRKQLAKTIELRRVPELEFFYDEVFENGMHFEKVLKGIKDEQ
jgi:ribosome-binding factor A